jgi:hypothetical protein
VALLIIGYGLRRWVRAGSPVLLLLVLGATVASLQEAPLDIFVSADYPRPGLWVLFETFGRPVPVWATFAWMILFAGAPYLLARAMERKSPGQVVWLGALGFVFVDIAIEVPTHAVPYYGDHPLSVGGFPLGMGAVNSVTMMGIATAAYLLETRVRGRLRLLAVVVPGLVLPAVTMTVGLPVFSAVGAGAPAAVRYPAVLLTFALAALALHGLARLAQAWGPGGRPANAVAAASQVERVIH